MVRYARRTPSRSPFKVAIFFSGGIPVDPDLLQGGIIELLEYEKVGELITIPTAHVWGVVERGELTSPPRLQALCQKEKRAYFQHEGGHEIPGSKDRVGVSRVVQVMRRAIWMAQNTE
jgi:hypothetical protein